MDDPRRSEFEAYVRSKKLSLTRDYRHPTEYAFNTQKLWELWKHLRPMPFVPDYCAAAIKPPGTALVFQCHMPPGYGTAGKYCHHHATKEGIDHGNA